MTIWLERRGAREEWRQPCRVQLCIQSKSRRRTSRSSHCRHRPREDGRCEPEIGKDKVNILPSINQWHHHMCPHSPPLEISVTCAPSFPSLPRQTWDPGRPSTLTSLASLSSSLISLHFTLSGSYQLMPEPLQSLLPHVPALGFHSPVHNDCIGRVPQQSLRWRFLF